MVAHAIHERSPRAARNFVAVDCCALQGKLFESELFGHEKGAFTGADRQKPGLIEAAHGGTLFLDEIGEIEPPIQAKPLRERLRDIPALIEHFLAHRHFSRRVNKRLSPATQRL